jgi:hypothetical protein
VSGPAAPELRRTWRRNWLASIREISADDWQRELWIQSKNPHHSPVEYLCSYFDDLVLSQGYQGLIVQGLLSEEEADAVADFHTLIDRYSSPGNVHPEVVLSDPLWAAVVASAARARSNLLEIISDPEERLELLREQPDHS